MREEGEEGAAGKEWLALAMGLRWRLVCNSATCVPCKERQETEISLNKLFLSTAGSGCAQHGESGAQGHHPFWRRVSQAVAFRCYGCLRATVSSTFPSRCMGGKSGLLRLAGL